MELVYNYAEREPGLNTEDVYPYIASQVGCLRNRNKGNDGNNEFDVK